MNRDKFHREITVKDKTYLPEKWVGLVGNLVLGWPEVWAEFD